MRVNYDSSLWDNKKGSGGTPQKVDWQFEYNGSVHHIPTIYRFSKGIVFDVITILDQAELEVYIEKYQKNRKKLTQLERRCAEQEHPYQSISFKEIYINDQVLDGERSSSSMIITPWEQDHEMAPILRKAYSSILEDASCFACHRFCMPYPDIDSKIQKILQYFRLITIKSFKFSTYPVSKFHPLDIRFELSNEESLKEIDFIHPKTGVTHQLYFQNPQPVEMPINIEGHRMFYTTQAMYEIEPALPHGDYLQFDTSMRYTEPSEGRFSPRAAGAIGIIGGACGPTAIFTSSKSNEENIPRGLHGLSLYSCCSILSLNKEDKMPFSIEGLYTRCCDVKTYEFK